MQTKDSYALITGASEGIGFELAKLLAADKYNLVIIARDQSDLQKAAEALKQYGVEVVTISKDLFEPQAAQEIYKEVTDKGLYITALVNNAGQGVYGKFIDTELERELKIIQLNIISLVTLTKFFIKDMVGRGEGRILNLSSIAGKIPGPYQAVYHGTKAFVHFFSEAIRSEIKDSGVTVTSLLPGATDTDFFNKADMTESKIVEEGKLGDPADVAKDGYDAMMAGKDMIVSGFKNKMQVAMSNMMPDSVATENMKKTQEPADKKE